MTSTSLKNLPEVLYQVYNERCCVPSFSLISVAIFWRLLKFQVKVHYGSNCSNYDLRSDRKIMNSERRPARASQTSSLELHTVYSLLVWAEHPKNHAKATANATALWQAKKRRLPRWPAMHTTLRSSHTFDVIIFCHLTLDCEIGRASIADSGCDCFKTQSSLPIPAMHLGFQSRCISFHQPATHNPLEVDYRFTSGHCTSPSFSFPYCLPWEGHFAPTDMFVWIRNPCWSSKPYLWFFFVISYQAWVDWGVWFWPCSLLFLYLFLLRTSYSGIDLLHFVVKQPDISSLHTARTPSQNILIPWWNAPWLWMPQKICDTNA